MSVGTDVIALYAHYLPDLVAGMVAHDIQESFAVNAMFESVLPAPYRLVVYRRFVAVYSFADGAVSSAFFLPREEVVPHSVIQQFQKSLPPKHHLHVHFEEQGYYGRIRDRLLDAFQFSGLRPLATDEPAVQRFSWLATGAEVTLRFDPDSKILLVSTLRVS